MLSTMYQRVPPGVTLCECLARDGLQHEPGFVPTATKRALVERFAAIGFPRVEATSYSNPKVIPQFSDASELLKLLKRKTGTYYKATCANPKAVRGEKKTPLIFLTRYLLQAMLLGLMDIKKWGILALS